MDSKPEDNELADNKLVDEEDDNKPADKEDDDK